MTRTLTAALALASLCVASVLVGGASTAASAATSRVSFEAQFARELVARGVALETRSSQAGCMDRLLSRKLAKGRAPSARQVDRTCDVEAPYSISVTGKAGPRKLAGALLRRDPALRASVRNGDHLAVAARRIGRTWTVAVAVAEEAAGPVPAPAPVAEAPDGVRAEIVAETNAARAGAADLPALSPNVCLMANAQRYAEFMAARDMDLVHQDLGKVRAECDGTGWVGENILYNYDGSATYALGQWMNSPGHRANILKQEYRLVGVGQARSASGRYYAVQVFASGVA